MKQALVVGISVMAGILIGRIQIIENHEANDAVEVAAHAGKRAEESRRDAVRTRVLLDATEKKVIAMWRRLEPMLEDFTHAESAIDRDLARQRIESLRWEMDTVEVKITAAREATGEDAQAALRQVYVKNFQ